MKWTVGSNSHKDRETLLRYGVACVRIRSCLELFCTLAAISHANRARGAEMSQTDDLLRIIACLVNGWLSDA